MNELPEEIQKQLDEPFIEDELTALRRWKAEALEIMATYDTQVLGELLGFTIGTPVMQNLEPSIRKLIEERDNLLNALEWSLEVIEDNLGLRIRNRVLGCNPEAGHCSFHDEFWNAKALTKEAKL